MTRRSVPPERLALSGLVTAVWPLPNHAATMGGVAQNIDSNERLLNLAMFLAGTAEPVSAATIRESIEGYPADQDAAAFERMFERDKKELRGSGLIIETIGDGKGSLYRLDPAQTFASPVDLTAEDLTVLGLANTSLANDPSFPFGSDLRLALAKLALETSEGRVANPGRLADEDPRSQGRLAAGLTEAARTRKRVEFEYASATSGARHRVVEPYGVYSREGRWYFVGRDAAPDQLRVFALARIDGLTTNAAKPGTPDFERPPDFDIAAWVMLPFQIGPAENAFEAVIRFSTGAAWRAPRLSAGRGTLEPEDADGSVTWRVQARDRTGLARWVVENGPGLELLEPAGLRLELAAHLGAVEASHA